MEYNNTSFVMNYDCSSHNVSMDSLTKSVWTYIPGQGQVYKINGVISAAILTIFLPLGLILNSAVIILILKKHLITQPTFILLLNLTITDFLLCLTVMPFDIIAGFAGEFIFGSTDYIRCKICNVGVVLLPLSLLSIYSVSLLSLDRFIFIKKPLRYHALVTVRRTLIVLVLVLIVCTAVSIPQLFEARSIIYKPTLFRCSIDLHFSSYTLMLVAVASVPLVLLIVCSLWVTCIVQKHLRQIYKTRQAISCASDREEYMSSIYKRAKREKTKLQFHLIRVFGAIIIANMVTWLPMILRVILAAGLTRNDIPIQFKSFTYLMFLFQSVLHPALEASLISEIKIPLVMLVKSICSPVHSLAFRKLPSLKNCSCNGGTAHGTCLCRACDLIDLCGVAALPPSEEDEGGHEAVV